MGLSLYLVPCVTAATRGLSHTALGTDPRIPGGIAFFFQYFQDRAFLFLISPISDKKLAIIFIFILLHEIQLCHLGTLQIFRLSLVFSFSMYLGFVGLLGPLSVEFS